jgi:hypothetical protein
VNKWRRFRRLPAPERAILLRALILLPLTGAALHTVGFRRWKSFLARFAPEKNSTEPVTAESLKYARRFTRMVAAASEEGIFHGKCLERSMVLWWFLLRRGFPAELQIGGRRAGAGFEAHAWVEIQGIVINDHEAVGQDFAPFRGNAASAGINSR